MLGSNTRASGPQQQLNPHPTLTLKTIVSANLLANDLSATGNQGLGILIVLSFPISILALRRRRNIKSKSLHRIGPRDKEAVK